MNSLGNSSYEWGGRAETVYLLQERSIVTGLPTGLYKLGYTRRWDVERRVKEYKAGNVRYLKILHVVEVADGHALEQMLHAQFSAFRIRGKGGGIEWFWGIGFIYVWAMNRSVSRFFALKFMAIAILAIAVVLVFGGFL